MNWFFHDFSPEHFWLMNPHRLPTSANLMAVRYDDAARATHTPERSYEDSVVQEVKHRDKRFRIIQMKEGLFLL
jgi:hypothetical protein